jgi:hypothetical protein
LSRQLADFLIKPLAAAGGVMQLPDVYCLFNRARGSELVSPDDLLQACQMFQQVCRDGKQLPANMLKGLVMLCESLQLTQTWDRHGGLFSPSISVPISFTSVKRAHLHFLDRK